MAVNTHTNIKDACKSLIFWILIGISSHVKGQDAWIGINQLGYRNNDIKVAVLLSHKSLNINSFELIDVKSGKVAMTFNNAIKFSPLMPFLIPKSLLIE